MTDAPNMMLRMIIFIVLLVVLILAFARPLIDLYNSLPQESTGLVSAKQMCNARIDSGQPANGCALAVAKQIILENPKNTNYLEAEAWLKKEIDGATGTETTILNGCFDFANTLYSKLTPGENAMDIYTKLNDFLKTDETKLKLASTHVSINVTEFNIIKEELIHANFDASQKDTIYQKTRSLMQEVAKIYNDNPGMVDYPVLGFNNNACHDFFRYFAGSNPDPDVFKYTSDVCNQISRASLKYSCYYGGSLSNAYQCASCKDYGVQSLQSDPCSGYSDQSTCEQNPCKGDTTLTTNCKWENNKCITAT